MHCICQYPLRVHYSTAGTCCSVTAIKREQMKGNLMDTRNEREMTALEMVSASIMVAGMVVVIGSLIYRLVIAFTN